MFYGTGCFLVAASGGFAWLAGLTVLTRLLLYVVCLGAIPRLKSRFRAASGTLRLPGGYTVPVLALAVCIGLLMQVKVLAYVSVVGFLAVGTILYAAARTSKDRKYSELGRRAAT